MVMSFFDAAAGLVSLGFKVFPLVRGGKVPLVKAWQNVASGDDEVIAEWARQWPEANIAIATGVASGVLVIDVDNKHGKFGRETLDALAKQGKVLPSSPIALTPSGGRHLYFRALPGVRNSVQRLGVGLDVRSDGGFVVAPPSRLAGDGSYYRWLVKPSSADFPRLPEWAVKMLVPTPMTRHELVHSHTNDHAGDIERLASWVSRSIEGERNNRLHWGACRAGELVAEKRLDEQAAAQRLTEAANACGLTGSEVLKTIRSGLNTGTSSKR